MDPFSGFLSRAFVHTNVQVCRAVQGCVFVCRRYMHMWIVWKHCNGVHVTYVYAEVNCIIVSDICLSSIPQKKKQKRDTLAGGCGGGGRGKGEFHHHSIKHFSHCRKERKAVKCP